MRQRLGLVAAFSLAAHGAVAAPLFQPPAPPPTPANETLFGVTVHDPYRDFEKLEPATIDWIKQQGDFTRSVFDTIPKRAGLASKISAVHARFAAIDSVQEAGGRRFFRRRDPGADGYDLVVQDATGSRKLIDIRAMGPAQGTTPNIDFFLASPDGSKVAVGISKEGNEDSNLRVYDAASGATIGDPVDRVQLGLLAWSDDSSRLYMNRLKTPSPTDNGLDRYAGSTVDEWNLKSSPRTFIDRSLLDPAGLQPTDLPQLVLAAGSSIAVMRFQNGSENTIAVWTAPKERIGLPTAWTPLVSHNQAVTAVEAGVDSLFLMSNANAPNFKVLEVARGAPISAGRILLPTDSSRVLESLHAAADGLYVVARQGIYSRLLKVGATGVVTNIPLPFEGQILEASSRLDQPGLTLVFESWTKAPRAYHYDPSHRTLVDLALTSAPPAAFKDIQVRDVTAPAKDGVEVPLTIVSSTKTPPGSPVLLRAYGSYGISMLPDFIPVLASFVQEGATYAICHVRGGGELGDAWRLAGKDANKRNTWGDLIACAEYLRAHGLAAKNQLFIYGDSAGSIAVGRAAADRPDLFAGVIDNVPVPNMLRLEFMPDGALETPEFGSIKNEPGFRNLLEMDSYQRVREGVSYPPTLLNIGLNDARAAPWQAAKMMARLLAAGDRTALLRVDLDAGHSVDTSRVLYDAMYTDFFSFVFWKSGQPGWQPNKQ